MKKVLAFFGAFNPPTIAHIQLAEFAMRETGREGVLFVPSKSAYIRVDQGKDYAYSEEARLAMLNAAAEQRSWMRVFDWEIRLPQQSRTYRTLCRMREEGYAPSLLIGSDKLEELETNWRHVREIAEEFGIVCMARGEDDTETLLKEDAFLRSIAPGIRLIETPARLKNISSTLVRERIREICRLIKSAEEMTGPEILSLAIRNTHPEDT